MNLPDWMSEMPNTVKHTKISDLYLVAAHNAASWKFLPVKMPGRIGAVRLAFIEWLRCNFPFWNRFIGDWTLCQNMSIEEQLEIGVRAIDLRLAWANNRFVFCHTFACTEATETLKGIKRFIENHPGEVVILDIKRDYRNRSTINGDKWREFSALYESYFGEFLRSRTVAIPTLIECQADHKRIITKIRSDSLTDSLEQKNWRKFEPKKWYDLADAPTTGTVVRDFFKRVFLGSFYNRKTVQNFTGTAMERWTRTTNKHEWTYWSTDGISPEFTENVTRLNLE